MVQSQSGTLPGGGVITGLRLQVQFDDPALQAYPWELCHDGRSFLFNNPDEPLLLARTVQAPPAVQAPVVRCRARCVCWLPLPPRVDQGRADVDLQEKTIHLATEEVATSSELDVQIVRHATLRKLAEMVRSYEPDIVHFIGYTSQEKEGALILENESGRSNIVPVSEIKRILEPAPVQCVMLSPIGMGETAVSSARSHNSFSKASPSTLADQFVLPDQPAVEFLRTFYQALSV